MRSKFLIAILVAGLLLGSFAAGNYASGQSKSKGPRWEYTILKHSPYLREAGSDFKEFQEMGKDGWELSSSYPVKGEIIIQGGNHHFSLQAKKIRAEFRHGSSHPETGLHFGRFVPTHRP